MISPDDSLGVPVVLDARCGGDIGEGAVAVVAKQLARRAYAITALVADVEVDVAVVVVVGPAGGLGRVVNLGETRLERHVGEAGSAVVSQQRVGVAARSAEPPATQNEHVEVAVVVVVGVLHVEPAEESAQTRLRGAIGEASVGIVVEEAHAAARVPRRGEDVEVAVAVEVVDDRAAAEVDRAQAELLRDVDEAWEAPP